MKAIKGFKVYNLILLISFLGNENINAQSIRTQARQMVEQGDHLLKASNYQQAIEQYSNAISTDDKYAEAYMKRSEANSKMGNQKEAAFDKQLAIKLNPYIGYLTNNRIKLSILKHEFKKAKQDFNEYLKICPNSNSKANEIAYNHYYIDHPSEAIANYTEILEDNPFDTTALLFRSIAYLSTNNLNLAGIDIEKVKMVAPEYSQTYAVDGMYYIVDQKYNEAIKAFDKAIELDEECFSAYYNRGYVHFIEGRADQAISDYSTALFIEPSLHKAYFNRAFAYKMKGQFQNAFDDYTRALEVKDDFAEAHYNRAIIRELMDDYHGALKEVEEAIEHDSEDSDLYNLKGNILVGMGNTEEAIENFEEAISLDNEHAIYYYNLGMAQIFNGNNFEGCVDIEKAINFGCEDSQHIIEYFCQSH
jgi:tetratricopeptide (TPR) repeat protein